MQKGKGEPYGSPFILLTRKCPHNGHFQQGQICDLSALTNSADLIRHSNEYVLEDPQCDEDHNG